MHKRPLTWVMIIMRCTNYSLPITQHPQQKASVLVWSNLKETLIKNNWVCSINYHTAVMNTADEPLNIWNIFRLMIDTYSRLNFARPQWK